MLSTAVSSQRSSNLLQNERKLSETSLWNQSTNLNLFNSIFRDPCHVSAKRTTSVSLKMQLYHVKHYLKSVNNYIFPNFHLCIQNLSVKVKVEGKKYNLGSYKMGHDSKLKCYNHSRARSSC